jgi:hypothetical protein
MAMPTKTLQGKTLSKVELKAKLPEASELLASPRWIG